MGDRRLKLLSDLYSPKLAEHGLEASSTCDDEILTEVRRGESRRRHNRYYHLRRVTPRHTSVWFDEFIPDRGGLGLWGYRSVI